jgi:hypothetical protein
MNLDKHHCGVCAGKEIKFLHFNLRTQQTIGFCSDCSERVVIDPDSYGQETNQEKSEEDS